MSEEAKDTSGVPEDAGSVQTESKTEDSFAGSEENKVDYLSFKKAVDREKKAVERARIAEEKAQELEQQRLEKEGKLSELVESLRAENQKWKSKTTEVVSNFAYKSVKSQLEAEAAKNGCLNPRALSKLVDLDTFDVDTDTFEASSDQLKSAIEDVRKENPWLFGKASPNINNSNPKVEAEDRPKAKSKPLSEMSKDELFKAWEKSQ